MAFLLAAPPFNYSDGVIGLFGLAGAAGALGARPAGGFADKGKSHHTHNFRSAAAITFMAGESGLVTLPYWR